VNSRAPVLAVTSATLIGFGLTALATWGSVYGLILFLGVPFLTGFLSVLVYTWNERRECDKCLWVSVWPFLGIGVLVLLWKIDGIICIAMAAPLAIPLGLLGGYIAWYFQPYKSAVLVTSCLLLLIPPGIVFGHHGPLPRTFQVSTSIVVNASPDVVWRHVTDFPDIAERPLGLFRAGVAYPLRTEIDGIGLGIGRRCVLSTGTLEERVIAWEPPYLLRFGVYSTPPAMRELSPWPDIDPPHLHGFYVSHRGEFRLTELPGHRTLVVGTSWYSHGLEPAQYWRLWSDYIVHGVHRRVLEHIKALAEEDNSRLTELCCVLQIGHFRGTGHRFSWPVD
jgi:hypothetical protein